MHCPKCHIECEIINDGKAYKCPRCEKVLKLEKVSVEGRERTRRQKSQERERRRRERGY